MKICKNCGKEFQEKNSRAIFCSDSCRVNYHQKQKRLKEKNDFIAFAYWVKRNFSQTVIWFILILILLFSIPYVFDKSMRIYTNYRVEWQNEKLIQLEEQQKLLSNKPRLLEENERLKYHLNVLLNDTLGWMTKESIHQYKKRILKKDDEFLQK
jgi:uncharacterized membrane protein YvbJ